MPKAGCINMTILTELQQSRGKSSSLWISVMKSCIFGHSYAHSSLSIKVLQLCSLRPTQKLVSRGYRGRRDGAPLSHAKVSSIHLYKYPPSKEIVARFEIASS